MSFAAYREYKDSGVPWLGEVPAHWKVLPLKWLLDANDGGVWGDDPDGEDDTIVLRSTEQTVGGQWHIDDPAPRKLSASEKDKAMLRVGDLLVTKSSGSSLHIGKTTLVDEGVAALQACYSNFMQRLTPSNRLSSRLAWYFLNSPVARKQLDVLSNSTIGLANLNGTILGLLETCLPPEDEQAAIAAFLDRETAKIDALVAEQERLIALLKEKRLAVISHAVTKGLNPHAPMKDSGIEWLGKIPAHWEIRRLKQVAVGQLSYGANEAADEAVEDHPRFVRITDVAADGTLRPDTFRSLPPAVAEPYLLEEGDILLARSGGTVGKSFIYRESWGDCCYAGYLIRLRVAVGTYLPDLVYMTLQSNAYWQQLGANQIQSTIQNFSAEKYGDMIFAFPPLEEQRAIASELSHRLSRFDELSHEAEEAITLLQERRAALISAAVTGKIDVRGLVDAPATAELEIA